MLYANGNPYGMTYVSFRIKNFFTFFHKTIDKTKFIVYNIIRNDY